MHIIERFKTGQFGHMMGPDPVTGQILPVFRDAVPEVAGHASIQDTVLAISHTLK